MSTTLNCQSTDIRTTIETPAPVVSTITPAQSLLLQLELGQGPAGPQGLPGVDGSPGPAGPPGPPGPPGSGSGVDRHYQHDQPIASAAWTINHNLAKFPAVQVFDSAGDEVEGQVKQITPNQIVIEFSAPFSGTAYCN